MAAVLVLVFAALVPLLVARRQAALDSRGGDRFSSGLRVLVTAGGQPRRAVIAEGRSSGGPRLHSTTGSATLADRMRARGEVRQMQRPAGLSEKAHANWEQRVAAERAAIADARSARRARARRRLAITLAMIIVTATCWTAVAVASFSWVLAMLPTVVLGVVLVTGRRAAKASERAQARERAALIRLDPRRRGEGGAWRSARGTRGAPAAPAEARTEASRGREARAVDITPAGPTTSGSVPADSASATTAEAAKTAEPRDVAPAAIGWDDVLTETLPAVLGEDRGVVASEPGSLEWQPVRIPAPTYTLKDAAPARRHEAWSPHEDAAASAVEAGADTVAAGTDADEVLSVPGGDVEANVEEFADERELRDDYEQALDVRAALARRRAVG